MKGTTTNIYGFYSLTLPAGKTKIIFRYVGYNPVEKEIDANKDVHINIALSPVIQLKEVVIVGNRIEEESRMSAVEIPIQQIKSIPALLGEVDVLKALQLLPGVHSGGEGSSGLYVRGGGPDQNLILLDGAPVYNAQHLFGFFSVFNADAIRSIELIKGGFPARYGGRLSSVIDIYVKEGNMKKFSGEGTVGIVASKMTVEGPIKKDTTSFLVSLRRTYIDLLARPFILAATDGMGYGGYYFYDGNIKLNHKFSDKDRVYASFYGGDDRFYVTATDQYMSDGNNIDFNATFRLGWGNKTSTLRWNRIISKKLFANAALTWSKFKFYTDIELEEIEKKITGDVTSGFALKYFSGINDWAGKLDFDYFPHPDHFIRFGTNYTYHTFNTGALQFKFTSENIIKDTLLGRPPTYATEYFGYLEDDWRINALLKGNFGLHHSGFFVGDTFYYSFQPRVSTRYYLSEHLALKGSFATMTQYIHLLSNNTAMLPTDLWLPVTEKVKPMNSQQVACGLARTLKLKDEDFEISVEGYYKWMQNLIEYGYGADFMDQSGVWEDKVETGKGWSYGSELFLQKKTGKFTGWIGYTLSWTWRQFNNLNKGLKYPYKFDRRHDISIVNSLKISETMDVAATWVYGTGNAITLPVAQYPDVPEFQPYNEYFGFNTVEYYGERNSFRMRSYHRLDLGANFKHLMKWGELWLNVSIYNVYSRKNPYFYYFGYDDFGNRQLKQVSLFPIIPSISFSVKF